MIFLLQKGREDMTRKNKRNFNEKATRGEPPNYLGQHLMHNKKLINEIVNQAKISNHELVIDIGAGKGALTSILSEKAQKVLAVEYDSKFVDILERKFIQSTNTKVIHKDILKMNFPKSHFIIVANIPYAITTPIMKKLLSYPISSFQRAVIVMEKGAAKRFTSSTVKDPYVIAWRMWFDIRYVKGISRKNFSPPPLVDSAMITIDRKAKPIVPYSNYLSFFGLVDVMLKNPQLPTDFALRSVFTAPQIKQLRRNLQIKNGLDVASLTEQQWGIIHETMMKHVPKYRWPRAKKTKLSGW